MTINLSHTIDDLLLRHAAGTLDAGFSLLVETHLAMSPAARALHAEFETLGGALLDEIEPAGVEPPALNRALRALDVETPAKRVESKRVPKHPKMPESFALPAPLARAQIGRWRWIAPGVRSAPITLPRASVSRAFLLEIAPGLTAPKHGHEGDEITFVLRGSFSDGDEHFGPGDIARVDEEIEHDLVIGPDVPCLCLIAMEGRMRPSSWFGRLYQKFRDI